MKRKARRTLLNSCNRRLSRPKNMTAEIKAITARRIAALNQRSGAGFFCRRRLSLTRRQSSLNSPCEENRGSFSSVRRGGASSSDSIASPDEEGSPSTSHSQFLMLSPSTDVGTDLNSHATFVKKKVPAEPAVPFAS